MSEGNQSVAKPASFSEIIIYFASQGFRQWHKENEIYSSSCQFEVNDSLVKLFLDIEKTPDNPHTLAELTFYLNMNPVEGDREYAELERRLLRWKMRRENNLRNNLIISARTDCQLNLHYKISNGIYPAVVLKGNNPEKLLQDAKTCAMSSLQKGYGLVTDYFRV